MLNFDCINANIDKPKAFKNNKIVWSLNPIILIAQNTNLKNPATKQKFIYFGSLSLDFIIDGFINTIIGAKQTNPIIKTEKEANTFEVKTSVTQ